MTKQLPLPFDQGEMDDLNARLTNNSVGSPVLSSIRDCETCRRYSAEVSKSWAKFREAYYQAKAKKTHIEGVWHDAKISK